MVDCCGTGLFNFLRGLSRNGHADLGLSENGYPQNHGLPSWPQIKFPNMGVYLFWRHSHNYIYDISGKSDIPMNIPMISPWTTETISEVGFSMTARGTASQLGFENRDRGAPGAEDSIPKVRWDSRLLICIGIIYRMQWVCMFIYMRCIYIYTYLLYVCSSGICDGYIMGMSWGNKNSLLLVLTRMFCHLYFRRWSGLTSK